MAQSADFLAGLHGALIAGGAAFLLGAAITFRRLERTLKPAVAVPERPAGAAEQE